MSKKTQSYFLTILDAMEYDKWYKTADLINILDVKETRTKVLLRYMADNGMLESKGTTKARVYKKVNT